MLKITTIDSSKVRFTSISSILYCFNTAISPSISVSNRMSYSLQRNTGSDNQQRLPQAKPRPCSKSTDCRFIIWPHQRLGSLLSRRPMVMAAGSVSDTDPSHILNLCQASLISLTAISVPFQKYPFPNGMSFMTPKCCSINSLYTV